MALPDAHVNKNLQGPGIRARVQRFGGHLAGMIMPNIGAFIAWGLITAFFIESGWLPNARLAELVGPMLYFLLPILIGYTGGRMVHELRGAVVGSIATAGVILGGITELSTLSGTPMFLGAMIMGPLAAFLLKKFDQLVEGKVKSGFEMLVDNFSLGILGMLLAIVGTLGVGPIISAVIAVLAGGVRFLVDANLLPLASIFVEPAKVLFLNNAINHGIFTPLAAMDVQAAGKSILFMVESNPGAGFGLLMAYMFFGPRKLRGATSGAVVIHLFGGIHEIFFPYILMKPKMILATIAGSMSGLFVASWLNAGLVASPSPGSIIAYFIVTPPGGFMAMSATVLTASIVSFVVASALLKFGRGAEADDPSAEVDANASGEPGLVGAGVSQVLGSQIRRVIIACDAGMGSSVMVASSMKKRLAPYGVDVAHTPVNQIPGDAQLVLTQQGLAERAVKAAPDALVVPFTAYVGDEAFDRVEKAIKEDRTITATGLGEPALGAEDAVSAPVVPVTAAPQQVPATSPAKAEQTLLPASNVRLGLASVSKEEAIKLAGQVLVDCGAAQPEYIDGMLTREQDVSTLLGEGIAIPHGTNESRRYINRPSLAFLQFPDGVDWEGEIAHLVIPIASNSDEHVGILAALATTLADPDAADELRTATSADRVIELLSPEE